MSKAYPQFKDKYYIYALCKPCGTPFYIGKGKGSRINDHFQPKKLNIAKSNVQRVCELKGSNIRFKSFVEELIRNKNG